MMKFSRFKVLFLAPSILLASCGYGLKETYKGGAYNSTNFMENYFNQWNESINPNSTKKKINETREIHEVSDDDDVFTSLDDIAFRNCDDKWENYSYPYDKEEPTDGTKAYGPSVKLSNYDDSFKYGVVSKMFDGQMFCNGDYANARTQVEPINQKSDGGFGVLFSKECNDASYFMMNFKCAIVTATSQNLGYGTSDLSLKVSFVLKNTTGYTYVPVTCSFEGVPTNSGDGNREEAYVCFGFSLKNLNLSRIIGFTVQYEKVSDTISPKLSEDTYHSIMLYEVSFPYTTWH